MRVPLYRHNLHGHDLNALTNDFKGIVSSMFIGTGPVCEEVQKKFASLLDTEHCILTNSWTGAMTSALMAANVGPHDEVIIPAMTFAATLNAVASVGARPVLVDIDPNTKLMDLSRIKSLLTYRTKAIIPVHLYGQMVDVARLREIIDDRNCVIFEDAAHAIESKLDGKSPGTHSDAAMFSFYASKNITCGEGGAIVSNDDMLMQRFKTVYRHGIDLSGYDRHLIEEFNEPMMVSAGIKANMTDVHAAMLKPQLDKIDQSHDARERIATRYIDELSDLGIEIPSRVPNSRHAWHLFTIGVDANERSRILNELHARGVRAAIHYRALNDMPFVQQKYRYSSDSFSNSVSWGRRTLSLPIFSDMQPEEQDYVISSLRQII